MIMGEASCTTDEGTPPEGSFQQPFQTTLGIVRINTRDVRIDNRDWVDVDLEWVAGSEEAPAAFETEATWQGMAAMHIRGNSSAEYEKKQFSVEFRDENGKDIDVSPFGLPDEEDWILQAPYSDKTLMRNHLMFQWSRAIGRYAPRTHFVELYMAEEGDPMGVDDYRGVYLFTEKIKRDKHRVNVEKLKTTDNTMPAVAGGYLLKRDWIDREALVTDIYEDELLIDAPKPERITESQQNYITEYLNDFERALQAKDGSHSEFADIDSFADHMMMMEMSRNVDAYVLSTFMHKARNGLLTMGPVWDFNGSLGNANYFESWASEGWHYQNSEFPGDNPNGFHWYAQLLKDDDFRDRLSERWAAHRQGPWSDEALLADIDKTAGLLQPAQVRNFERWPILGESIWPNDEGAEDRHSYEEEVDYLKRWLTERTAWLDVQWL